MLGGLPAQAEIDEAEEEPVEDPAAEVLASGSRGKVKTGGKKAAKKGKRVGKREEDLSKLPQEQRFLLDIEALDKQYGADNWRITFWHGRSMLQVQPAQPYALNTYTPVISVGLEHALVNVPGERRSGRTASPLHPQWHSSCTLSLPWLSPSPARL